MSRFVVRNRRTFIGGSDARIIMGNDEAALIQLWREKRGEADPEEPGICIVILSSTEDQEVGLMGLRAGASGFLAKSVGVEALPRALRGAKAGEAVVSRRMAMRVIEGLRKVREDGSGMRPVRSRLTSREWEVLDLLCDGRSTEDVADTLVLSAETVRSHVKHVLGKLGVHTRAEAVEAAERLREEARRSADEQDQPAIDERELDRALRSLGPRGNTTSG